MTTTETKKIEAADTPALLGASREDSPPGLAAVMIAQVDPPAG